MKTSTTRTEDKSNQIDSNVKKEWHSPLIVKLDSGNTESGSVSATMEVTPIATAAS